LTEVAVEKAVSPSATPSRAFVWVLLAMTFLLAAISRPHVMPGLINDEAVEFLQAQDMPSDRTYYFAPPSYAGDDFVEAVGPYLNRAVWHVFGVGTEPLRLFYAATLVLGIILFRRGVRRVHGEPWATVAAVLFGGSSYALFYSQILTRNALTPFWAGLLVWLGVGILDEAEGGRRLALRLAAIAGGLTLALATYTSFKVATVALFLSLGLCLAVTRRWRTLALTALCAAVVAALTVAWAWSSDTRFALLMSRGAYAIAGEMTWHRFSQHAWRTYLLPIWRDRAYNDFIIEETNIAFARGMLPTVAAPFFVFGLLRALRAARSRPCELWAAAMFLVAVPFFALGGPNLKHCFLLLPWVLLLTVGGARAVFEWSAPRTGPLVPRLALLGAAAVFIHTEAVHLFRTIPANTEITSRNNLPLATAACVNRHSAGRHSVVAVDTLGLSILRWELRAAATAAGRPRVEADFFTDRLSAELAARLQEPDALVVVQGDTDPRFLFTRAGLRDCFEKRLEKAGEFTTSLFFRKDTCDWNGMPPDRLEKPLGLALAANGELLVASGAGAIQRIAANGAFLGSLGPADYADPNSVAVDAGTGDVYVADTWGHRIVNLSADGRFVRTLPLPPDGLYAPRAICVAPNGEIFVANAGRSEILRYDQHGNFAAAWGRPGDGPGELHEPLGLTVADGEVYVADALNHRIQVFSRDGKPLRQWPIEEWNDNSAEYRGMVVYEGRLYVSDPNRNSVLVFTTAGARLDRLTGDEMQTPSGLAVSPEGVLFINSQTASTISQISLTTRAASVAHHFAPVS
jgi:sugar lactone lactonase YvrE